jgi:signal transduction histidine kinase/CheY-like chemotaxis protein
VAKLKGDTKKVDTKKVDVSNRARRHRSTVARDSHSERAQLVLLAGDNVGQIFPVHKEALLGRHEEAEVRVDDTEVSREHAKIRATAMGSFVLKDLDSRNGTMLNGARIEQAKLELGDRIQLGSRIVLQFMRYEPVEDQIRHRQRLETLGRLSAGLAHDLNNMLAVIAANLEFLDMVVNEEDIKSTELDECIADIKTATEQAGKLTPRFLDFARADERTQSRIDVSQMCDEVGQVVRRTFNRQVRVESNVARDLFVNGSNTDLHHVMMNLCVNARDAMPEGGNLRIEASMVTDDTPHVLLRVSDDGMGMPEDTQARIFEPFFTTKARGSGVGLGLATVRDIVRAMGGEIRVESTPHKGSTFTVRLPAAERPTHVSGGHQAIEMVTPGVVLVVDDEAIVRRGLVRLLEHHGHQVLEAKGKDDALATYASTPKPDVVILDLDLAGSSGEDTLAELLRLDPRASVILHSGDKRRANSRLAKQLGAKTSMIKPASPGTLGRALQVALGEDRPSMRGTEPPGASP